jgi:phage-related protein
MTQDPKPLFFIASSEDDLSRMPSEVKRTFGYALFMAQCGLKHLDAKPLKGFKGAGVLEVVDDNDGDTFRAVYTVRFEGAVYVLHAFQKKSKKGIGTPKTDIDKIKQRLTEAEKHWMAEKAEQAEKDRKT